jgi:hypothetical protein
MAATSTSVAFPTYHPSLAKCGDEQYIERETMPRTTRESPHKAVQVAC